MVLKSKKDGNWGRLLLRIVPILSYFPTIFVLKKNDGSGLIKIIISIEAKKCNTCPVLFDYRVEYRVDREREKEREREIQRERKSLHTLPIPTFSFFLSLSRPLYSRKKEKKLIIKLILHCSCNYNKHTVCTKSPVVVAAYLV